MSGNPFSKLKQSVLAVQLIQFGGRQTSDFAATLKLCKEAGIQHVEVNYCKLPKVIPEFLAHCRASNVSVHAGHVRFEEISTNSRLSLVLSTMNELSCPMLICSGMATGTADVRWRRTARWFKGIFARCREQNVEFLYHPYKGCVSLHQGRCQLDDILDETADEKMNIVLDSFWCNSVVWFDSDRQLRLLERCRYFHLKDGFHRPKPPSRMFVPLGEGEISLDMWLSLIRKSATLHRQVSVVIEQDTYATDPFSELVRSMQYLLKKGLP